jgi:hypothetical protein
MPGPNNGKRPEALGGSSRVSSLTALTCTAGGVADHLSSPDWSEKNLVPLSGKGDKRFAMMRRLHGTSRLCDCYVCLLHDIMCCVGGWYTVVGSGRGSDRGGQVERPRRPLQERGARNRWNVCIARCYSLAPTLR